MADDDAVTPDVFIRLEALLRAKEISFKVLEHNPVYTSAEAATVRGVDLHTGAKALLLKVQDDFLLAVMPADHSLDSRVIRQALGWKNVRFATKDEVSHWTALQPGAIPPFGSLFGLRTFCDPALGENDTIYFNAGSHSKSLGCRMLIICASKDRCSAPLATGAELDAIAHRMLRNVGHANVRRRRFPSPFST
jgi:Ala-tRNA(Pro) deacylase